MDPRITPAGHYTEGGVRVPGVMVWPGTIQAGAVDEFQRCHSDLLPTVLDCVGHWKGKTGRPMDGMTTANAGG